MIALKDNLPLLGKPRGHAVAFRRAWLQSALKRAAEKAGYSEWWIAEDLTKSVIFYLEHHYLQPVIAVPLLENAVRSALREIGYFDVAAYFGAGSGVHSVSLLRFCVPRTCLEPQDFFDSVDAWFAEIAARQLTGIAFHDLELCARRLAQLQGRTGTANTPETLRARIVEFIHQQLTLLQAEDFLREVRCSIS